MGNFLYIGFEVLTTVVMKSTIIWYITLHGPLKVNRRFGGTYRLHLQGRISRARYQRKAVGKMAIWYYIPDNSTFQLSL
jgi:hypothetical protein